MAAPWRGFYLRGGNAHRLNLAQIPRSDAGADVGTSSIFGVALVSGGPVGGAATDVPRRGGRLLVSAVVGSALVLLSSTPAATLPPGQGLNARPRGLGSLQITFDTAPGEETLDLRPQVARPPRAIPPRLVGMAVGQIPPDAPAAPVGGGLFLLPPRTPWILRSWVQPGRTDAPVVGQAALAVPYTRARGRGAVWFSQLDTAGPQPFGGAWTLTPPPRLGALQVTLDTTPGEETLDGGTRSAVLVPGRAQTRMVGAFSGPVPPTAVESLPAGASVGARPVRLQAARLAEYQLWYVIDDNAPRAGQLTPIPPRAAPAGPGTMGLHFLGLDVVAATTPVGGRQDGLPLTGLPRRVGQAGWRAPFDEMLLRGARAETRPGRLLPGRGGYVQQGDRTVVVTALPPGGTSSTRGYALRRGPVELALWYVVDDNLPRAAQVLSMPGRGYVRPPGFAQMSGRDVVVATLPPGLGYGARGVRVAGGHARARISGDGLRIPATPLPPGVQASAAPRAGYRRLVAFTREGLARTTPGAIHLPCEMWQMFPGVTTFLPGQPYEHTTWDVAPTTTVYTFDQFGTLVWVFLPGVTDPWEW